MAKKKKNKNKKQGGAKKANLKMIFVLGGIVISIIALPTTLVLACGTLPTLVSFIVDKTKNKSRTISVAALNVAAAFPFLMGLWKGGNSFDGALQIISNPVTIVVMYVGALAGYCMDWTLSGVASSLLYKKAQMRVVEIKKRQKALIDRWGRAITGQVQQDAEYDPYE